MPVENLVQVNFEDLVFAIVPFNTPRQNGFTHLTSQRPLTFEKERTCHLLRNRARPLLGAVRLHVHPHRA